jgi:hypothetical protein
MTTPLRVAIVHHHLKRGGVTRVIESTLRGFRQLKQPPACVVLCGEAPSEVAFPGACVVVPGLQYSNAQTSTPTPEVLCEQLRHAARTALGGDPDLWHIHNHSLGKNTALPGLVALLAAAGEALLLQMHDFAEDGRPDNYRLNQSEAAYANRLYPGAPHVHYAVLNQRDRAFFKQTGIASKQLHLLANPVETSQPHGNVPTAQIQQIRHTLGATRLFLSPVRAVRRKNFGELLLWAALAPEGDVFATTLGPTNQNYYAAYQRWQTFAQQHQLPVYCSIAEQHPHWEFEAIMQSADAILSTSIAEGFGLAFLEPWLFGKAIIGRNLPQISGDFVAHDIDLGGLYSAIGIPADWIDLTALRSAIQSGLNNAYAAYATPLPNDAVDRALDAIRLPADRIDFAGLDETQQQAVIARLIGDKHARQQITEELTAGIAGEETIQHNAAIIQANYSAEHYAQHLSELYEEIAQQPAHPVRSLDAQQLLNAFLKPENFRLLRT